MYIVVESFFAFMMLLNFFEEYTPANTTQRVRNHFLIAKRYVTDKFLVDLLCLIPFNLLISISGADEDQRFLLLIKILRLHEGFQMFNVKEVMKHVKNMLNKMMTYKTTTACY